MRLYKHNGLKALISVILVLCGLWLVTANTGNNIFASVVNTVTYPLRKLGWAAAKTADSGKSAQELEGENEALRSEINSLRNMLADYYDLKRENEQLRKYFNIKSENTDFSLIPASVINRDPNGSSKRFTVDAGTVSGVAVNDPVLTENGLIGYVSQVDISSCTVTTVLSENAKISVIDKKTSDMGVLCGKANLWDENKTAIIALDENSSMKPGDIITTSGMGGVYPPNLVIGTVNEIKFDDYDTSKYAVVAVYEDIKNVSEVVILTDYADRG